MIDAIKKIFAVEELKKRIIFTLMLLVVCRLGAYISIPGINSAEVVHLFQFATGGGQNLFQLVDMFTGGEFAQMTVTALGVMPYITASVVVQVLAKVIPCNYWKYLKKII